MYSYYSFICKKRSHPCKLTALVVTLLTLAFVLLQLNKKSILKSNCQKFYAAFKRVFSYANLFIVFPTNGIFVHPVRLDAKLASKSSLVV